MATTKVTRLDHYPKENPTGWAVGFTVTTNNNRSFYRDTVISYTDASNDNLARVYTPPTTTTVITETPVSEEETPVSEEETPAEEASE